MNSIKKVITDKFVKLSVIPIIFIELSLILALFLLNFYQSKESKRELEKIYSETFKELSLKISDNINLQLTNIKNSLYQIQTISNQTFSNPENYLNKNLNISEHNGFFSNKKDELSSIYTTNIEVATESDLKTLELLSRIEPLVKNIVERNSKFISSAWINIDKRYALSFPSFNLEQTISPNIDVTQYQFYFLANPKFNSTKEAVFVDIHNESWALSSGEIGVFLAPIYQNSKFIGVIGLNLTIDIIANSLTDLKLPFNSYAMLTDKSYELLVSSDEKRSFEDFQKFSFLHKYRTKENLESGSKIDLDIERDEKIIFENLLENTEFKLIITTEKDELFSKISHILENVKNIGYLIVIAISILYLIFLSKSLSIIKKVSRKISEPLINIVNISNRLGTSRSIKFKNSNIKELNNLNENLIKANDKLINLIIKDELTGVFNRRKLLKDVKNSKYNSLILINIIQFKHLNSVYGNEIGDFILKNISLTVANITKLDNQSLYRVGADVFAILTGEKSKETIEREIQKLLSYFENSLIDYSKDIQISINLSMGIAIKESIDDNLENFAETALSISKQQKSKYTIYSKDLDIKESFRENIKWAKKIKHAIKHDNIEPFYQPIYNLKSKQIEKFEALVRLIDNGEVISPFFFLEPAKNINLLNEITKIVIDKVFKTSKEFPNLEFSINISFSDLEHSDFLEYITMKSKEFDIINYKIVFEILETENSLNDLNIERIHKLKNMGFKIAIDDFGAGYSNFAHILNIKTDYLKIDGAFIKNIDIDQNSLKITKTISKFAQMLKVKTIAEFVANEEILKTINKESIDIDYIQGYLISPPVKKSEIEKLLKTKLEYLNC